MSTITEIAEFTIATGREQEFEQTMMTQARQIIAQAAGFVSIEMAQGIERPSVYQLLIKWRSVESHLEGFRNSVLYEDWSALVRPFFAEPAKVEHFNPRMNPFRG